MPTHDTPALPPAPPVRERLGADLLRVLAPNPSPMTYWGTNTYLLGRKHVAVIDPGPDNADHVDAILSAVPRGGAITHILVTHAHLDHSPGAARLSRRTGAPVYAFGGAADGRSAVMQQLAEAGLAGGGEGVDTQFAPDHRLPDGARLASPDWEIEAVHTPGHMGNHLCFAMGDRLFSGDLVMGWASSLVSPPDGDLTDFMASCRRLLVRDWSVFHPGHGGPIDRPRARLTWLIDHRLERERQIRVALRAGAATVEKLARTIYTDTPPALLPAAIRNVFAHLVDLHQRGLVQPRGGLQPGSPFELIR